MTQLTIKEDIAEKSAQVAELKPLLKKLCDAEQIFMDILQVSLKFDRWTRKDVITSVSKVLIEVGNIRSDIDSDIESLESDLEDLINCDPLIDWIKERMNLNPDEEVFTFNFRDAAKDLDMTSSQVHNMVCSFGFDIPEWYVNWSDVDCTITRIKKEEEDE